MIKNPFARRKPLSPERYQSHVLALLRSWFADEVFDRTDDPLIIKNGEVELGLQNLYSQYLRDAPAPEQHNEDIRTHFTRMLEATRAEKETHKLPWEEAQHLLRPQFMPPEYGNDVPVIALPFADEVAIGLVLDLPKLYSYVRIEDSERWGRTSTDLLDRAVRNLDAVSGALEAVASDGPEKYLAIQMSDGYDAVRLLVPGIRAIAAERLGSPCLAAIPNRDFLFFWSVAKSPAFQAFTRQKVQRDREIQPYPLTSMIFSVTETEVMPHQDA